MIALIVALLGTVPMGQVLALAPDNQVVTGYGDLLYVVDPISVEVRLRVALEVGERRGHDVTLDRRYLLVAGRDGVQIIDLREGSSRAFTGTAVSMAAISADGKRYLVVEQDGFYRGNGRTYLRLRDAHTGEIIWSQESHWGAWCDMSATMQIACQKGGGLVLLDARGGEVRSLSVRRPGRPHFSPSGARILVSDQEGYEVHRLDVDQAPVAIAQEAVVGIEWVGETHVLERRMHGSRPSALAVRDLASGTVRLGPPVWSAVSDGDRGAFVVSDGQLAHWKGGAARPDVVHSVHSGAVTALSTGLSTGLSRLAGPGWVASGGEDGRVVLLDAETGSVAQTLALHEGPVAQIISLCGAFMSVGEDGRVWRIPAPGSAPRLLHWARAPVRQVVGFGGCLLGVATDDTVWVFDVQSGLVDTLPFVGADLEVRDGGAVQHGGRRAGDLLIREARAPHNDAGAPFAILPLARQLVWTEVGLEFGHVLPQLEEAARYRSDEVRAGSYWFLKSQPDTIVAVRGAPVTVPGARFVAIVSHRSAWAVAGTDDGRLVYVRKPTAVSGPRPLPWSLDRDPLAVAGQLTVVMNGKRVLLNLKTGAPGGDAPEGYVSPDGQWSLVWKGAKGVLRSLTNDVEVPLDHPHAVRTTAVWTAHNELILGGTELLVFNTRGKLVRTLSSKPGSFRGLVLSPDGTRLFGRNGHRLWSRSLMGGELEYVRDFRRADNSGRLGIARNGRYMFTRTTVWRLPSGELALRQNTGEILGFLGDDMLVKRGGLYRVPIPAARRREAWGALLMPAVGGLAVHDDGFVVTQADCVIGFDSTGKRIWARSDAGPRCP